MTGSGNVAASAAGGTALTGKLSTPATPKELPNLADAPPHIKALLETQFEWGFDIFALERVSQKRPLVWLGLSVLTTFNAQQSLQTDEVTIRNWLSLVESNYRANPYHNSTHAADVMQVTCLPPLCDKWYNFASKPMWKMTLVCLCCSQQLTSCVSRD